jgi:hypothetical protein
MQLVGTPSPVIKGDVCVYTWQKTHVRVRCSLNPSESGDTSLKWVEAHVVCSLADVEKLSFP